MLFHAECLIYGGATRRSPHEGRMAIRPYNRYTNCVRKPHSGFHNPNSEIRNTSLPGYQPHPCRKGFAKFGGELRDDSLSCLVKTVEDSLKSAG